MPNSDKNRGQSGKSQQGKDDKQEMASGHKNQQRSQSDKQGKQGDHDKGKGKH